MTQANNDALAVPVILIVQVIGSTSHLPTNMPQIVERTHFNQYTKSSLKTSDIIRQDKINVHKIRDKLYYK